MMMAGRLPAGAGAPFLAATTMCAAAFRKAGATARAAAFHPVDFHGAKDGIMVTAGLKAVTMDVDEGVGANVK